MRQRGELKFSLVSPCDVHTVRIYGGCSGCIAIVLVVFVSLECEGFFPQNFPRIGVYANYEAFLSLVAGSIKEYFFTPDDWLTVPGSR